jgi:hypothetical protein
VNWNDAQMEEFPFLKAVVTLLLAVVGMVFLAASAGTHSGLDAALGSVLFLGAFSLFRLWFAGR